MKRLLIIRFSSLGDLCLLGWAAAARRDRLPPDGSEQVTLVTKPAYADLMRLVRGIDEVVVPDGTGVGALARLAGGLRRDPHDLVLDAHNVLRSHLLLGLMGRRPQRRLAKDTAARLLYMRTGKPHTALQRTMGDRFDEVVSGPGDTDPHRAPQPPLDIPGAEGRREPILGLAPGAMWETKRWLPRNFADLARAARERTGARIRIFLGPREESWFSASPLGQFAAAAQDSVEIIDRRPLVEVASLLADCSLLVTNDSGLLHLAEAVGTPVLAFFGPTVRAFGYFPRLPASRVIERPLDCRPCSRNGKRPCHRGDLACLTDITLEATDQVLQDMWRELAPKDTP